MRWFGLRFGLLVLVVFAPSLVLCQWSYDEGLKYRSQNFQLDVDHQLQTRFTHASPDVGDSKGSFDVPALKSMLSGTVFDDWEFGIQLNFADGSETSEDLLEDAFFKYTRKGLATLWVGQGKVNFGRQEITHSSNLQFVDRSIASERFAHGRDVGVALLGENAAKTYSYSVGVYNGNGINKDEGDNVDYMAVGRLSITPLGEFEFAETDFDYVERCRDERGDACNSKLAIGVSGLSNTVGTEGIEETRVSRGGLELAFRKGGWNLAAEFFTESADPQELDVLGDPDPDEKDTDGWYFQGAYLFSNHLELAGRYSEILKDDDNRDETEAGVAVNYYLSGYQSKIQLDFRQLEFEVPPGEFETEDTFDRDVIRLQFQLVF